MAAPHGLKFPYGPPRRGKAEDGRVAIGSVLYVLIGRWGLPLTDTALVLGTDPQTVARWRQDSSQAEVDENLRLRLSYVLGIYRALTSLIPTDRPRNAWFTHPSNAPLFEGRAPIEMLRESGGALDDLCAIRHYLDGECERQPPEA